MSPHLNLVMDPPLSRKEVGRKEVGVSGNVRGSLDGTKKF